MLGRKVGGIWRGLTSGSSLTEFSVEGRMETYGDNPSRMQQATEGSWEQKRVSQFSRARVRGTEQNPQVNHDSGKSELEFLLQGKHKWAIQVGLVDASCYQQVIRA